MLDPQGPAAGLLRVARLKGRHDLPRILPEQPRLIDLGQEARPHEAAVAPRERQFVGQGGGERRADLRIDAGQRPADLGEGRGQVRRRAQRLRDPQCRREAVAHRREVARPGTAEADAGEGARQVRRGSQRLAAGMAEGGILDETGDGILPPGDAGQVGERPGQMLGQEARAVRRHRAVDGGEQAPRPLAGEGARQFEVGPRGGIDGERRAGLLAARHGERRAGGELGAGDVEEARSRRRDLRAAEPAEPVEGRDAVLLADPPLGGRGFEFGLGQRDHGGLRILPQPRQGRIGMDRLGQHDLARVVSGDGAGQFARRDLAQGEPAGGDVDGREAVDEPAFRRLLPADGEKQVGARGIEEAVLGDGAGGDEAHHLPPHHGFRAALLGLGGVLGLLADGDPVPEGDEAAEVIVGPLDGHAAHRDLRPGMLAALGQDDAEGARGDLRVAEEQLVEIAHPVEQEAIRVGRLDLDVLRHHRRGADRVEVARLRRRLGDTRGAAHAAFLPEPPLRISPTRPLAWGRRGPAREVPGLSRWRNQ